jgi:exodeoxyribonuclease V beta subunit
VVIDPTRHGVIEASAGTGKTHTLLELTLQLLADRRATLDQILLVTYTEKATGELKDRLRQALEKGDAPVFRAALDEFDQAPVYTIHGFCQRVLQEYAFENRHDFRAELVYDAALLEPCLREVQRRVWPALYGDRLAAMLQLGRYDGATWESRVMKLAGQFRPLCQHTLLPKPLPNLARTLTVFEDNLRSTRATLRDMAGDPVDDWEKHSWCEGFRQVKHHAKQRESWINKVLVPLLHWLFDPVADTQPIASFLRLLETCRTATGFAEDGFQVLSERLKPEGRDQLVDLCPGMTELLEVMDEWQRAHDCSSLDHQLAVQTVQQVHDHLAGYKRERGWQSFEDMLTRVDAALDPERNPHAGSLLAALRGRYRYAIVDEFQDTDPLQWRIFKQIFVSGAGPHRLFVVGDPKQAIFGFRGADLAAYQKAGSELREQHGAATIPLAVNWRSSPEVLEALNQLFRDGGWFEGTGIACSDVQPAAEAERPWHNREDHTGRAALNLVELEAEQLTVARRHMARFIATESARLLRAGGGLVFGKKGEVARPLQAGDLCVLVARRREATPVLEALRHAGIPYTLYKQTGLWQSAEAIHLGYLLRALANPADNAAFHKALLTRFFRIEPAELAACEELSSSHPARELFLSWCALGEARNWGALFQAILEESGVLFDRNDPQDAERRQANYRHITQALAETAYAQDLDLEGVVELLEQRRRQPEDPEHDTQPIETDRSKLKIMTIHAAKGLEFPVVFLAGGFTMGARSEYLTYRDHGNLVFDLRTSDAEAKAQAEAEQAAELRRLYYVALTRPMFKLYVPHILVGDKKYSQKGPLVTIVAPALDQAGLTRMGAKFVETIRPEPASESVTRRAGNVSPPVMATPGDSPTSLTGALFPAVSKQLVERRIRIRSFTSLHRAALAAEEPHYEEKPPRADDDVPDALEDTTAWRGPVFGEMLHEIMAAIDFSVAGQAADPPALLAAADPLFEEVRRRHWARLPARLTGPDHIESCRAELARMAWHGLHTPLAVVGGPLWQIPASDRLHELEFHFPEQANRASERPDEGLWGRTRSRFSEKEPRPLFEGFLTGFIDLVFRKQGRFFLLDWKTNVLPGYSPREVAQSMMECDYTRQFRLYVQALACWLGQGRGFDPMRDFGGIYYLYVRGLNGRDENAGVFFHRPNDADLELQNVLA